MMNMISGLGRFANRLLTDEQALGLKSNPDLETPLAQKAIRQERDKWQTGLMLAAVLSCIPASKGLDSLDLTPYLSMDKPSLKAIEERIESNNDPKKRKALVLLMAKYYLPPDLRKVNH